MASGWKCSVCGVINPAYTGVCQHCPSPSEITAQLAQEAASEDESRRSQRFFISLFLTSLGQATLFLLGISISFILVGLLVGGNGAAPAVTHVVIFLAQLPARVFKASGQANPWAGILIWTGLVFLLSFFVRLAKKRQG